MLKNKIALITGAAGGIGAACAELYAEQRAAGLVLTDVREEPLLEKAKAIEEKTGCKCVCMAADIRKEECAAALVELAKSTFGKLDVVVNSAGISRQGKLYDVTEAQWDLTFAINVKGLFFICREAMRQMEKQKEGCIINISSQAGREGGILVTPDYPASKAGVLVITKSLAKAGAKHGIRVNSVSPGLIATDMTTTYNYNPETVPLKRIGTGRDVAGAVLFLASEYASYITGACVDVNGGISMI